MGNNSKNQPISSTLRRPKVPSRIPRESPEHSLTTESISSTESDSGGYSTSTTPMDSEDREASWNEYRHNLRDMFYCFAGRSSNYARKKGLYMSKAEVRRFLEIVHIADYWSVDEVFAAMDSAEVDGKVKVEEFVEYFCDSNVNPKVHDLKEHIEKQSSWKLLLKALQIIDEVDTDKSGTLEYDEFKLFAHKLDLDDKETEVLWNTIDTDNSGQITIFELFDWFKRRLEAHRQNVAQQTAPNEFSQSHSSFDHDDSTTTQSAATSLGQTSFMMLHSGRISPPNEVNDDDDDENEDDKRHHHK